MKAAILDAPGKPLAVRDVQLPLVKPNSVRVRVQASHVLSFTDKVLGGHGPFELPTPYIPGPSAVGLVEEIGEGVSKVKLGDRVFCTPHFMREAPGRRIHEILIGWFPLTPESKPLALEWRNGSFAEQAVYPAECVTVLDGLDRYSAETLVGLNTISIAYGAALRAELRPGAHVAIGGATGNIGAATVLVALAMGAGKVYVLGRDVASLAKLVEVCPARVVPIGLGREEHLYVETAKKSGAEVDVYFDVLGVTTSSQPTLAGISLLRRGGTAIFFGGVRTEIPLPYSTMLGQQLTIRGSFMAPTGSAAGIVRMVAGGGLDLDWLSPKIFRLETISDAIAAAPKLKIFDFAVVQP